MIDKDRLKQIIKDLELKRNEVKSIELKNSYTTCILTLWIIAELIEDK